MICFLDTSILVKLYYSEKDSDIITELLKKSSYDLYISELAKVEFFSAIYRKYRENELSTKDVKAITKKFETNVKNKDINIIFSSNKIFDDSINIIKKYAKSFNVKTLDIMQVSYALSIDANYFYTADIKLKTFLKETQIISLILE